MKIKIGETDMKNMKLLTEKDVADDDKRARKARCKENEEGKETQQNTLFLSGQIRICKCQ